ncbi:MAG: hypothetical protein EZS28_031318 [Streblomastix strix]|uniref:Uncharacterized protein n=1 Tax=Streblomastix strix TaxID=222440 RepID=A0A5J4US30_9EUKA|nr:MAG: hypothetical protein EZS28_031318 [Streblomastix strix]
MNQAQALKNLMENGTSIEYFNDGYIMKAKDKIKVYEEGKKSAKTLSQAQQTKLLLKARGGGQTKPKRATKRQIESDFDDADDEFSQSERKFQQTEQLYSDDEENDQTIVEKPVKTPKPTPYSRRDQADSSAQKKIRKPQINYTSPQVDLEELIRLRTENAFIKQQHQDSIKQVEKYKEKIKIFKQKKAEESQHQPQTPPQEQVPEPQEEIPEIRFNETDLW